MSEITARYGQIKVKGEHLVPNTRAFVPNTMEDSRCLKYEQIKVKIRSKESTFYQTPWKTAGV